jgi:hypothetical protein
MADPDECHPGLIPDIAGVVDTVPGVFVGLKGKYGHEGKDTQHTHDKEEKGIQAIEPPKGFQKDSHAGRK